MDAFMFPEEFLDARIDCIQYMIAKDHASYLQWDEAHHHRKECDSFEAKVFFEKPEYSAVMLGIRCQNYKRPFRNNYQQNASTKNKLSLCYNDFVNSMDVIGYAQPYEFYIPPDSSSSVKKVDRVDGLLRDIVESLHLNDNNWAEINQDSVFEQAAALTKRLFKSHKKMGKVVDFTFKQKLIICENLELNRSPGLPFCRDPFTQFQANCIDRMFQLAEEIDASAMANDPTEVEAPPCALICKANPETLEIEGIFYPPALKIIEDRFVVGLMAGLSNPNRKFKLPIDFEADFENTKNLMKRMIKGKKQCCVVKFKELQLRSVHPELVDFAFSVIKQWLDMKSTRHSAEENKKVFGFLKKYFKLTPVLLPTGQLIETVCGGMRGSEFASLIKSIAMTFAVVYGMLNQGVAPEKIEGNIHCINNEIAFSVIEYFSTEKLRDDLQSLGFSIDKDDIRLSNKSRDLQLNGYTVNGRFFDFDAIVESLYKL